MHLVHVLHYSCSVKACCCTCWPTNHLHRRDGMCVLYNNTCVCMYVTYLSMHAVLLTLPLHIVVSVIHEFHCVGSCLHLPLCRSCMSGELKEAGHMASWQEGGVGQIGYSHYGTCTSNCFPRLVMAPSKSYMSLTKQLHCLHVQKLENAVHSTFSTCISASFPKKSSKNWCILCKATW